MMFRTTLFFFLFTIGGTNAALKRMRNPSYEIEITNRRSMTENRFTDKNQVDAFLDTLLRDYGESSVEMQSMSMSMSFPFQPERPPAPSASVVTPPGNSPVVTPTTEGSPVSSPPGEFPEATPTTGGSLAPAGQDGSGPTGEGSPIATPTNASPVVAPSAETPVSNPTEDGFPVAAPVGGETLIPSLLEGSPTEVSPVETPTGEGSPVATPSNASPVETPTQETPVSSPTEVESPVVSPTEGFPVAAPAGQGSLIPTLLVEGSPVESPTDGSPVLTPTIEMTPTSGAPAAQGGDEPTGAVPSTPELGPSSPTASEGSASLSPSSNVILNPDEDLPTVPDVPSSFPTSSNPPSDFPSISSEPTSSLQPSVTPTITDAPSITAAPTLSERNGVILEKCGISQDARSTELVLLFSNVSNPVTGMTPGTPQWWARMWIDQNDGYVACPENARDTFERYILALLYFATEGEKWVSCSSGDLSCPRPWLSDEHHCNWFGVSCNKAKRVTKLVLKENGLTGPLDSEVFALSSLVQLSLDHNKINGTIASSIGDLAQLQILELDENLMSGALPSSLYSMSQLKAIDLNDNSFVGGLAAGIANLTELMVLQVENNNFTDSLPVAELSQLEKLILFSSHGNQLAGSFEDICQLMSTRRQTNPTYLQFFATDCSTIPCSCCSECF